MITIRKIEDSLFEVTVKQASETTHQVTLKEDYYQKLTGGIGSPEELIKRSFEFLLERESSTMILRSFDLPLIGHYFPEFEREMKRGVRE